MNDPLELFLPETAAYFREAFHEGPTAAQRLAWPAIAAGENVLLVSPTGTGKTLAAFLVALDRVVKEKLAGRSEPLLRIVYVSPLRALGNDIHRNLEAPRAGIASRLGARRVSVDVAVRTGDTPQRERTSQVKRPPDVLITTPESLYLLLTSPARRIFAGVSAVILDEVHAVAGTKRGVHLAISLERLEAARAAGLPPLQRIGLSATVSPVNDVAAFVGGTGRPVKPLVVDAKKALDLTVAAPSADAARDEESAWRPAIARIAAEVDARRSTIVFCNNRRHAERVAALLGEARGASVPTHHGSIAKPLRETIERSLKQGELKVLVATGSLELGIDVGSVESVVLLTSPKGIARSLQRVGRSGHLVGETARGLFVPLFGEDLLECAAIAEGMKEGDVEETRPPEFPLDVLAQQLVAETVARAAAGDTITADGLYALVRRAAPYERLTRRLFDETLAMLSGKYPKERFAELAPKLVFDRATGRVTPLPAARLAAILDGGTIGDRGVYKAVLPDGKTVVGELDEEFVYEIRQSDVFLLGSREWRALEISHDKVVVEPAPGQPARMPFWRGEGLGRPAKLGERLGQLKRFIAERLEDPSLVDVLRQRCASDEGAAVAIVDAVRAEAKEPGGVASDTKIVFETFPNHLGDPCIVVRSVFGRAVNLPWSLALASVLREETGVEIDSVAGDDGVLLRAPRAEREIPLERLARLTADEAKERLLGTLPNSPMFGARFRENAQRALLLPRARAGKRTPFWLQRLKAKDLLQTTRGLPDFPIVVETYRDCLRDLWDFDRLLRLLSDLEAGTVERVSVSRPFPSPASKTLLFGFVAAYVYEWDAPKAEKGLHALSLNRELLGEVLGDAAAEAIRPEAAREAQAEASRTSPNRAARDPEELLLFFQELGDLTGEEVEERAAGDGMEWLMELMQRGSVVVRTRGGDTRFIAAEERDLYGALHKKETEPRERILLRYFSTRGPALPKEAAARYGLPLVVVEESLERLRREGLVVSGRFGAAPGTRLWAGAKLAETIRKKTLQILRREIRPVPAATFRALVAKRQGVSPGSRFTGIEGAERAVGLLRGILLPAVLWETAILPARLATPEPDALDVLSSRGILVWRAEGTKDPKAARLSFLFRGEGASLLPPAPALDSLSGNARKVHEALALSGAMFAFDLEKALSLSAAAVDKALVELVLAGLVTGDGLFGLRELMRTGTREPKEKATRTRRAAPALGKRPTREALRAAEKRVAERLQTAPPKGGRAKAPTRSGRFSLLHVPSVLGDEVRADERAETWARLLLARWGVVSRAVLEREDAAAVRWSDVAPVLARMELRGDLRRGEFVDGQGPMQYAEPDTVEILREMREKTGTTRGEEDAIVAVAGADPVLFGLASAPSAGDLVALAGGEERARLGPSGELTLSEDVTDRSVRESLVAFQELKRRSRDPLARPRQLVVEKIEGRTAASSPYAPMLSELGFTRDGTSYVWRAL